MKFLWIQILFGIACFLLILCTFLFPFSQKHFERMSKHWTDWKGPTITRVSWKNISTVVKVKNIINLNIIRTDTRGYHFWCRKVFEGVQKHVWFAPQMQFWCRALLRFCTKSAHSNYLKRTKILNWHVIIYLGEKNAPKLQYRRENKVITCQFTILVRFK